jgi:hypothetical protein
VILGIRPEDMEDAQLVSDAPANRRIRSEVLLREALGADVLAHIRVAAPAVVTEDVRELAHDVGQEALEAFESRAEAQESTFIARLNPRTKATKGTGASDDRNAPAAGPFVAFGLAIIPFVFVALAFLSEHPRAPGAVVKALAVSIVVGIPLSALAGDAVTGLVAGLGAGGVIALRPDVGHTGRSRAIAVVLATLYAFLMVRVAPEATLLVAPVLPFSSIGIADHLRERRPETA